MKQKQKHNHTNTPTRREFLTAVSVLTGASIITALPGAGLAATFSRPAPLTVKQVIDIALSESEALPARTVDQLKIGNPEQQVTGIVTTAVPTIAVIKQAIAAGANMIIAHEATFFNNDDANNGLKDDDIYKYKLDLITKNNIAIWRFHDGWHAHKPDGIMWGALLKLGWEKYYDAATPKTITLPQPLSLGSIVELTKKKLNAPQVRVIGDVKKPVKTVFFALGSMPSTQQIAIIQQEKPDLILSGEAREWETCERVRDGFVLGLNTKLIALGHAISEEAGMEYAATWLAPKVNGIKVAYIAGGTPFKYV